MSQEAKTAVPPVDVLEAVVRIMSEQTKVVESQSGSLKADALNVHVARNGETVVTSKRIGNLRLNWREAVSTVLENAVLVAAIDNEWEMVLSLLRGLQKLHGLTEVTLGDSQAKAVLFVWKATKKQTTVSAAEIAEGADLDPAEIEGILGELSLLGAIRRQKEGRVEMADTILFQGLPPATT